MVVVVEAWAVVEVVAFVWIFCGRLWLWLRAVGGFGFLVVVVCFLCILLDFLCVAIVGVDGSGIWVCRWWW